MSKKQRFIEYVKLSEKGRQKYKQVVRILVDQWNRRRIFAVQGNAKTANPQIKLLHPQIQVHTILRSIPDPELPWIQANAVFKKKRDTIISQRSHKYLILTRGNLNKKFKLIICEQYYYFIKCSTFICFLFYKILACWPFIWTAFDIFGEIIFLLLKFVISYAKFISYLLKVPKAYMNSKKILSIELKKEEKPTKLEQKFPSINFTSTSRALMSLSRQDKFDSQVEQISAQLSKQIQLKSDAYQQLKSARSTQYSLNKFRQTQNCQTKIGKTLHFVKKYEKERIIPPSLKKLPKPGIQRFQKIDKQELGSKMPIKQQFCSLYNGQIKFCDKKFGCVDGYAISSHVGALSTSNNTRICVATNILRSSHKAKQVSFFGLFQGRNGVNKAEYMREHFHNTLISDELFYYNFQKAISRTFQKIDRDFNYDPRFDGDYSVANSIMCIVLGLRLYMVKYGTPNGTISMKLGQYIKTLVTQQKQGWLKQKKSISSLSNYNQRLTPKQSIHIRSYELNGQYDFIILGNEGIYHSINHRNELGSSVWKYMLDQQFHSNSKLVGSNRLARTCNKICEDAVKKDPFGRSMSMILIQFENMSKCFQDSLNLHLPYTFGRSEEQKQSNDIFSNEHESLEKQIEMVNTQTQMKVQKNSYEMSPRYLRSFSNLL